MYKKKLAQTPNLKMMSAERCIKKIAENLNLKMINGERCIKRTSWNPKPKDDQLRTMY
jgi:hypothetical protein